MIKKTWSEFKKTGLFWWINQILHTFGWAIVYEYNGNELIDVYPARVEFRGFKEEVNRDGYIKVSQYLKENCNDILNEASKK